MKKWLVAFLLTLVIAIFTQEAFAAEHNISATGTYVAGSSETLDSAKQHAMEDAMRQAIEQVGVLVVSYSKTHNMILTDDEVMLISSKIVKIQNKKFDIMLLSDCEIRVMVYIDVVVDTKGIDDDVLKLKRDNQRLVQENSSLKELNDRKDEKIKTKEKYDALAGMIRNHYLKMPVINHEEADKINRQFGEHTKDQCLAMFYKEMHDTQYDKAKHWAEMGAFISTTPRECGEFAYLQAQAEIAKQDNEWMMLRLLKDVQRVYEYLGGTESEKNNISYYYQTIFDYVVNWKPKVLKLAYNKTVYFYGKRAL